MFLPQSVLPYIPAEFVPGDRLMFAGNTIHFTGPDEWQSPHIGRVTDAAVRQVYTDPRHLEVFGAPLLAPAPVPADKPLPGRPVSVGEDPFEGRPYLMAADQRGEFKALVDDGPWGTAQRAGLPRAPKGPVAWTYEMSLTDTGRVWYRAYGLTVAYIPAQDPTDEESVVLLTAAVLRTAFPADVTVIRLSDGF